MSITKMASTLHKWLAVAALVPILFWFSSGLFFALSPIERVRSEHLMARAPARPVALDAAANGLARLAARGVTAADRVEIRHLLARPVAVVTQAGGRPTMFDLGSGAQLSPLSARSAAAIAAHDYRGRETVAQTVAVTQNSPEYRGPLPAWEVRLAGTDALSIYVSADTGLVTARRSALWRTYDFLWGLHILDPKDHANFNSWLLVMAVGSSLILLVTGIILIPVRLGWIAQWQSHRAIAGEDHPA